VLFAGSAVEFVATVVECCPSEPVAQDQMDHLAGTRASLASQGWKLMELALGHQKMAVGVPQKERELFLVQHVEMVAEVPYEVNYSITHVNSR